ncbi:MAG: hypothetical protein R2873_14820 [Caldilineaceae bacterium]
MRSLVRVTKALLITAILGPAALALAASSRPLPPSGGYPIVPLPNEPAPAPVLDLMPDTTLYNQLVSEQQHSAQGRMLGGAMTAGGGAVEGPGVLSYADARASGATLFRSPTACLTFDDVSKWNSQIWQAAYGNWGTFSVNDGGFYKPENVRFDMEQATGPGDRAGSEYSFKIAGHQPYAAGLVSPVIAAPPGSVVTVWAKYLMYNHDGVQVGSQVVNDWVSLGLKPDAQGTDATYVNGYVRGQWAELANSIVAGESGEVLILLQAESPAALNSNIYFDDIEVNIGGRSLTNCE